MSRPPPAAFVGRVEELTALLGAMGLAAAGSPTVTLVGGDAGTGKTRLLNQLVGAAEATGALTLLGSCVQVGDYGLPYLPIIDALRAVEADPDGAVVLKEEAAVRPALARLLPQLQSVPEPAAGSGPSSVPDDSMAQGQLFEALLRVLTVLSARRTVVLVLEDLHWADRSTRDFLAFLARTLRDGRIAVVASYRTDDLHRRHPLRPLLAELTRLPHVRRIDLPPFSRAEIAELLDSVVGSAVDIALVEQVYARSEGNAFFAEELVRAGAADPRRTRLPDQLTDILLGRVEQLSQSGQLAVRVAAVAGRRVPHDLLLAAADSPDWDEGLRNAVEAGLLTTDGDTYEFRHALYQEAVYGDLLPGERVRLHARFAELLAEGGGVAGGGAGGKRPPGRAAELAHHLLAGHDLPRALQALIAAATSAERMAAPGEALRHLEQALAVSDRIGVSVSPDDRLQLLRRASEAAAGAGDAGRAAAFGRAAVVLADELPDIDLRAATRERLARLLFDVDSADPGGWPGDPRSGAGGAGGGVGAAGVGTVGGGVRAGPGDRGVPADSDELCLQALALLPPGRSDKLRARVLATAARSILSADPSTASGLLAEATALAEAIGAEVIAADCLITSNLLLRRGYRAAAGADPAVGDDAGEPLAELPSLAAVVARAEAALEGAGPDQAEWLGVRLRALRFQATQLMEDGDLDGALAAADQGVALSVRAGLSWASYGLDLRLIRGWVLAATGSWDEVLADSSGAAFAPTEPGRVLATLAVAVLVARGDAAAEALLGRLRGTGDTYAEVQLDLCEIDLRLAQGRFDRALEVAASCLRKVSTTGWEMERLLLASRQAAVHADLAAAAEDTAAAAAHVAAAAAIVDRQEAAAPTPGVSGPHGRSWHCRLRAEAARAAGTDTAEQWEQVRALAEAAGRVQEQVYAATRAGRRLLEAGKRQEAAAVLAPALAQAESLRAAPMAAEMQELVQRGRLRVSSGRPVASPVQSPLTAREAEVLALVARGLSNRAVGQSLFISEKTASVHLSHILAKLGAGTRTEAAAVARQRGLLSD